MTRKRRRTSRKKSVLVDSGPLLLWFVGTINPGQVHTFKRTKNYCERDYRKLCDFLAGFDAIATTPNILTEVSNLGGYLIDDYRSQFFDCLAEASQTLLEEYRQTMDCARLPMFNEFGLTDTVAFIVANQQRHRLLTDDSQLAQYARAGGVDVVHFHDVCLL